VTRRTAVLVAALVVTAPSVALAQPPDDPVPPGTAVLGPVRLTPSLVLRDMGVDNNVFNEAENPKTDFTFTVAPRVDVAFRARRLHLTLAAVTDFVYFKKYESERSTNASAETRLEFDLGRLRPYVNARGVDTRSRLNTEVDTRARHHDVTYGTGVSFAVASRTRLLFNAATTGIEYEEGTEFRGEDLKTSFDSRRDTLDGGFSMDLTPITRFSVLVAREQQRFDFSTDRDSDTWRITPGLSFNPAGLVTGSASVGYRHFHPLSPALPDYSGLVSAVSVGATIYGRHHVQGVFNRDVQYSYDEATDYYLGTTVGVTWTMLVAGPIDVRGTGARTVMDYRNVSEPTGRDVMNTYGGGIGYRFGSRARAGFNVEWLRRDSDSSTERRYRNHRYFFGLTWGTTS
jgi:hypothetical protein